MSKQVNYNSPAMLKARIASVKRQTAQYQKKLELLNELQSAVDENCRVLDKIREHNQTIGNLI